MVAPGGTRRITPLLLRLSLLLLHQGTGTAALAEQTPASLTQQLLAASDWKGGTEVAFEGCKANSGEYSLWVYAKGDTCGVPRAQAERVVMFRQPLPGVSPIRAVSLLPAGIYHAWAFGSGDPGHPWINLCAKTCAKGGLPPKPAWVPLGEIEVRDQHLLLLKTWEQPDGHQLEVFAIALTVEKRPPEWRP